MSNCHERSTGAFLAMVALLTACGHRPTGPVVTATARYATVAAVVDDVAYVVGGIERSAAGDTTVASVEAYDPDGRSWTRCAPMPTARAFAAAAEFDGRIYVFGGLDAAGKALDVVEVYDPRKDAWSTCPPMRTALSRIAAVRHMDLGILYAGGLDADGRNSAEQHLLAQNRNNEWADWMPLLPSARHGLGLADANDGTERMFAVGGYDDSGALAAVDWWGIGTVPVLDENGKPLRPGATSTDSRTGTTTAIAHERRVYLWQPGPPLKQARGFLGVATIGPRIYAVGGRCPTIPGTEILDMGNVSAGWRQAAPLPKDLCRFSLVAWNGHLLAFGGETDFGRSVNTDVLEYDPAADRWSVR